MTSIKLVQFSRLPTPLSICVQNSSTPLIVDVQFQKYPLLEMLIICYQVLLSDRLSFSLWTDSLILSGFPLASFHSAKASLSAFSWLYTLVRAVVQKYHEMSFLLKLLNATTCFICKTWKFKQQPHRACERTKSKWKQNQITSHSNRPCVLLFNLAHKQCNDIIKGWFYFLTSELKGRFLVNNILFGSA